MNETKAGSIIRAVIVLGLGGIGIHYALQGNPLWALFPLAGAGYASSPFIVKGLFCLPGIANWHANRKWQGRSFMFEGIRVRADVPEDPSRHALIAVADIEGIARRPLTPRPNAVTPGDGMLKGVECLPADAVRNHLLVMQRMAKRDIEQQHLRKLVLWIDANFVTRVSKSADDDKRLAGSGQKAE